MRSLPKNAEPVRHLPIKAFLYRTMERREAVPEGLVLAGVLFALTAVFFIGRG